MIKSELNMMREICRKEKKIFSYFKREVHLELKTKNGGRKHKYHFEDMHEDIKEIVIPLLQDADHMLLMYINEVSPGMRRYFSNMSKENRIYEAYEEESALFFENLQIISLKYQRKVFDEAARIKHMLKEIYADLGAIYLLDIDPLNYLEAYLLSESYIPDSDTINTTLLNRVALVNYVLSDDAGWKEKWEHLDEKREEMGEFLYELKKKSDLYLGEIKKKKNANIIIDETSDDKKTQFDPFTILEIVEYEKDYLESCKEPLKCRVSEKRLERDLLKNVYKHFLVIENREVELSFDDFFREFSLLVEHYKEGVEGRWKMINKSRE